jgi:hypothetical protein
LEYLHPQIIAHEPSRCEGCFDGRLPLLLIVIFIGLILFLLCLGVILDADGESTSASLKVQCHKSHFFFKAFLMDFSFFRKNFLMLRILGDS